MPWLIGIDEAGYGPNLGPFVMTATACRLDNDLVAANLWELLRDAVRRPAEPNDGRLVIEDSKQVYTPKEGLTRLEAGVLGTVTPLADGETASLSEYLGLVAPASVAEVAAESWYTGTTPLPLAVPREEAIAAAVLFKQACVSAGVSWLRPRAAVVCATRFNRLLDRWDTKGAVLGQALGELLRAYLQMEAENEPLVFSIDKHGGRNTYSALLQDAVPLGFVQAHEESPQRSTYSIRGLGREVRITFQPRADAEHFCVALASMISKYLREVLMHEFNDFWRRHVPGLVPTAGYPTDAKRFYAAIQPAMRRLGLAEEAVWRRR